MKKILWPLILIILFTGKGRAQLTSFKSVADDGQFNKKGDQSVNVYYGYRIFNALKDELQKQYLKSNSFNGRNSSIGPVGLVYEYFVEDKIGLGCELGYSSWTMGFDYKDTLLTSQVYSAKVKSSLLRIMFRGNLHFAQDKNFDAYFFASVGYRGTFLKVSTNDPAGLLSANISLPVFFGVKPGIGLRYFFDNHIGLHAEIAAGTPVLLGGLSVRF